MATERIYFHDSHRLGFEAQVVEAFERDGQRVVVLDRTAFYPTGGGQPHDTGVLSGPEGEWRVDDVIAEEASDRILHVVSRDFSRVGEVARMPEPGSLVTGSVDGARRRDHLQQHTGQHILSQAFVQVAAIETRSFHLGAQSSTIDVDPRVDDAIAARALALANEIVFSDVATRVHVVGPEELERFKVRKQTFHGERIRLIEIEGFDVSTCGGTHAHRTGEVGVIAIRSIERQKGLHRVEFVCGGRAARAFQGDRAIVQGVARLLSTGADAVVAQVQKLVEQTAAQRKRVQQLFALAADGQADELLARAQPLAPGSEARVVSAVLSDLSFDEAQLLARKVVERGGRGGAGGIVALLGVADPAAPKLLFTRDAAPGSALAPLSMGALVKQIAEQFGGRGGGSATSAQASIARVEELEAALAAARAQLAAQRPASA